MAANKTKPTGASVGDYLTARGSAQQRVDCRELITLLQRVTQHPPHMWGPSIVGFGSYRYAYPSGRTGEAPLAAFAIRGREIVIYLACDQEAQKSLVAKLGPHKMSKCCLYFKRLEDLNRSVLEKLVVRSVAEATRSDKQHDVA